MEKKPGCSVHVSVTCTDENGEIISDIPSGAWYGWDRASANALATDLVVAMTGVMETSNEAKYGPNWREKIFAKDTPAKPGQGR